MKRQSKYKLVLLDDRAKPTVRPVGFVISCHLPVITHKRVNGLFLEDVQNFLMIFGGIHRYIWEEEKFFINSLNELRGRMGGWIIH